MNRKIILSILIILIIGIVFFMIYDLFFIKKSEKNPYIFKTDSTLSNYDTNMVSHKEIMQIHVNMNEIHSIAIDKQNNLIVAGNSIIIFDSSHQITKTFKIHDVATAVAINSKSQIFIGLQNHIEVWNTDGKLVNKWKTENSDSYFTGLAVSDDYVFIADATERIIHQYDLTGKFIKNIGGKDTANDIPQIIIRSPFLDIALGRDDEIWIGNSGRYMLESFDIKGNLKSIWGKHSTKIEDFGGCCNPTNFIVLTDGTFITAEKALPRVKIYSPDGKFISIVAPPDLFNAETKGLDLAVDSQNRIYILDPLRKQIRIFEKK